MGASHTKLSFDSGDGVPDLEGDLATNYSIDGTLFPGSGRMMRTTRLRHKANGSMTVRKSMWVFKEDAAEVSEHEKELIRIKKALHGQSHVTPFLYWTSGEYRPAAKGLPALRPLSLVRPYIYTTLSDRLASRPFLTPVEKLWIVYQILRALEAMHNSGVVHGFLTTENIGLTSWNWVVLTDIASYKARTSLPDDDPSEYLYYFQELYMSGTDTAPREKRCYLAPERFYTPNLQEETNSGGGSDLGKGKKSALTPAMDMFSAGCVIMEAFLNGERALDLGDLMEYRSKKKSASLQQKLNKIDFSALRAACKHMLHLEPTERLTANGYIERLQASQLIPGSFTILEPLMERVTQSNPDARVALAASRYSALLEETTGIRDVSGKEYTEKALGETILRIENLVDKTSEDDCKTKDILKNTRSEDLGRDLFAETDALLKKLNALYLDDDDAETSPISDQSSSSLAADAIDQEQESQISESKNPMCRNSLLIYLQLFLSTIRYVQRPATKLIALQLINRLGRHSSDEARLQRIVPVTVSLLQDQDSLVRASAIQVLTGTLSSIESFPPSDSKLFTQYIFKRVAHMITDPALIVRLAFARSIAVLAETSHQFLDTSHAVRLFEAVDGGNLGSSSHTPDPSREMATPTSAIFTDDLTKLLDHPSEPKVMGRIELKSNLSGHGSMSDTGRVLIRSTYNSELAILHEAISRWVMHIATDQSEYSSPPKRALLSDLSRLCSFFGLEGIMSFILPQILTFLNDRKDWQLRLGLFQNLPSVCYIIGKAATEHFVLPCLETGLTDAEEQVISEALRCLSELLSMGLVSRAALIGMTFPNSEKSPSPGILKKYGVLLIHPSVEIRHFAISVVNEACKALGFPDADVFAVPRLHPYLRFHPSQHHLTTREGLEKCLKPAWSRSKYQVELDKYLEMSPSIFSGVDDWTSVGIRVHEPGKPPIDDGTTHIKSDSEPKADTVKSDEDVQLEEMQAYLRLVGKRKTYSLSIHPNYEHQSSALLHKSVEGSIKLATSIKFPRQDISGPQTAVLPSWYQSLRDALASFDYKVSESAGIRSASALFQAYGLSISGQNIESEQLFAQFSIEDACKVLKSNESQIVESACLGQWGSEAYLDPTLTDTSLLVAKLKGLRFPTLPPRLNEEKPLPHRYAGPQASTKDGLSNPSEWKPKIGTLVASSICHSDAGHTALISRVCVSHDQRFFVTSSHDGTCRIWDMEKAEQSNGVLESSSTYTGHLDAATGGSSRINDGAMVEGSHSVVSGSSNGSVHVWRVDMVSSATTQSPSTNSSEIYGRSRVAGTSEIRQTDLQEGEILTVGCFNSSSASILLYGTQKGYVHSWDLRSAVEPFNLRTVPGTGYLTSLALGNDRHWVVAGSSKGYMSLWDLRFQKMIKLWQHSHASPINRLAASYISPPRYWTDLKAMSSASPKPFIFAACGSNECAMFDLTTGDCHECFRTINYGSRYSNSYLESLPFLKSVPLSANTRRWMLIAERQSPVDAKFGSVTKSPINAMVGSIGAGENSYLLTGGSDCRIRYWDFNSPSKCYISSGGDATQRRPSFERIDYDQTRRLMLCREPPAASLSDLDDSRNPQKLFPGLKSPKQHHQDAIQDLKAVSNGLLSCSRDCTVKLWR